MRGRIVKRKAKIYRTGNERSSDLEGREELEGCPALFQAKKKTCHLIS